MSTPPVEGGLVPGHSQPSWPAEGPTLHDDLLAALDRLLTFVTQGNEERPWEDYLEVVRLDQEVCALCRVIGLPAPPIAYLGYYGDEQVGFCRVPVTRHSGGCLIWNDPGWALAMQGLRRTAELARDQQFKRGQGTSSPAELWAANPVEAFERLKDGVCDAIDIVAEMHRLALSAPAERSLAEVGQEHHEPLRRAVADAQAIWSNTPISRYLDRPQGPVWLDGREGGLGGGVTGSCYHDLALGVAAGLLVWARAGMSARDFLRAMRLRTAAGDDVGQHLANLATAVRCECRRGALQWEGDRGRAREGQADPVLSTRQQAILEAMYELGAFDADGRRTTEEIAAKAEGMAADAAGFKEPIAVLGSLGFVESKRGRNGGCWLTPKGRQRHAQGAPARRAPAEKVRKS